MGFCVVLPAQREDFHSFVADFRPASAHADPLHMVQVGSPAADAAALMDEAGVHIVRHVVYVL